MKKIKLLTSLIGLVGLSTGLVPMLSSCGPKGEATSTTHVDVDEAVTEKGVSVLSASIKLNQDSTIIFNLPTSNDETLLTGVTITVGGQTIDDSYKVISGSTLTIKKAAMTSIKVAVKDVTLLKGQNFLTCSWTDIGTWCEKLENDEIDAETFAKHFHNGKKQFTSLSDFLGLERKVKINNRDHTVRVVGTQHANDLIVNQGWKTSKKAALTFDLKTLLCDNNGDALVTQWDGTTSSAHCYDFPNSNLFNCLNTDNAGNWRSVVTSEKISDTRSVWQMLSDETTGTPQLVSVIKTVNKMVATNPEKSPGASHFEIDPNGYDAKLFPFTNKEIGLKEEMTEYLDEGITYEYWVKNKQSKYLYKNDINNKSGSGAKSYWLSSPAINNSSNAHNFIMDLFTNAIYNNYFCISFGFCI